MVLGFWEIPESDQPPPELWGNDEALTKWFEGVKASKEEERKGTKLEEVPLMQNELELPDLW